MAIPSIANLLRTATLGQISRVTRIPTPTLRAYRLGYFLPSVSRQKTLRGWYDKTTVTQLKSYGAGKNVVKEFRGQSQSAIRNVQGELDAFMQRIVAETGVDPNIITRSMARSDKSLEELRY